MSVSDKTAASRQGRNGGGDRPTGREESRLILDRHWHLSENNDEIALTELEIALFRTFAAFDAWQHHSQVAAADESLNRTDCMVLNIVRMKDRAKTAAEITRLLNRDDISNIQYSLRKLEKLSLIQIARPHKKKSKAYEATEKGRNATEMHAQLRRELMTKAASQMKNWQARAEDAAELLDHLRALYEHASMVVTIHKGDRLDGE